jgi:hypothetical protein
VRGVSLVGSSHRWAAAAILLLGMVTCGLGSPTALSLLTAAFAALWLFSTVRHVHERAPRRPAAVR